MLEAEDEAFDAQQILERLAELRRDPLDPNRATYAQLQQIPYLSTLQIRGLVALRQRQKLQSLDDLLRGQGMDPGTLARIRPFLQIRPARGTRGHLRSRAALILPPTWGTRQGLYLGDPTKLYLRLKLSVEDHLRMGLLGEKDPGEEDLTDYMSGYLELQGIGRLRRAVVGDFTLEFGQGLVLWTGGGPMGGLRSADAVRARPRGIGSYAASDENKGLRGLAVSGETGPVILSAFLSRRCLDAAIEEDVARSLDASGLHRNPQEMAKRDALDERLVGAHVGFSLSQDKILGLTWYRSRYSPGLHPADLDRRRYAFRGTISQVWGGHFDLAFGPFDLFGEVATTQQGARAAATGLLLENERLKTTLAWRRYGMDFNNPHGAGPAATENQNEMGMFFGLTWRSSCGTRLEMIADGHRRSWRSYLLAMPSTGESWMLQAVQPLGADVSLTVRHKRRHRDMAATAAEELCVNTRLHQRWWRFQLDWKATSWATTRGRCELTRIVIPARGIQERGALLLAQMKLVLGGHTGLQGLVTFFRIPSYDSRMYVCEVGPQGVARNVALFGRGSRAFLLVNCKMINGLQISLRFCSGLYDDRLSLGDGPEQREGNVKREVLLQVDCKW